MSASHPAVPPGGISPYYGYLPSEDIAVAFIASFSLSTLAHFVQAFNPMKQLWVLWSLVPCGLIEVVSWGGQLWSHDEPMNLTPFILQSTLVTTAPAFLFVAVSGIFAYIIKILGPQYSPISTKSAGRIFMIGDTIALALQTVGGALGSSHATSMAQTGSQINTAGIIIQNVVMGLFILFAIVFIVRYSANLPARRRVDMKVEGPSMPPPPTSKAYVLTGAVCIAVLCMFARTVYRSVKALQGSESALEINQVAYNGFEGGAIAVALVAFNLCHPGNLLRPSGMWQQLRGMELSNSLGDRLPDAASSQEKFPLISKVDYDLYPTSCSDADV